MTDHERVIEALCFGAKHGLCTARRHDYECPAGDGDTVARVVALIAAAREACAVAVENAKLTEWGDEIAECAAVIRGISQ